MSALRVLRALCALAPAGRAAAASYVVDVWDAGRGLPGNAATAIAQTPDGYLWIGSYNGLARFDGVRFVTFDPSNTPALRHPRIERLFTDASGTLWINTHDGSLASWRAGRFATEWARAERVEPGIYPAISSDAEQAFVLQSGAVARARSAGGRVADPPAARHDVHARVLRDAGRRAVDRLRRRARVADERRAGSEPVGRRRGRCARSPRLPTAACSPGPTAASRSGTGAPSCPRSDGGRGSTSRSCSSPSDGAFWAVAGGRLRKGRDGRLGPEVEAARALADGPSQALAAVEDGRGGMWFAHDGRGLVHVDAARRRRSASGPRRASRATARCPSSATARTTCGWASTAAASRACGSAASPR